MRSVKDVTDKRERERERERGRESEDTIPEYTAPVQLYYRNKYTGTMTSCHRRKLHRKTGDSGWFRVIHEDKNQDDTQRWFRPPHRKSAFDPGRSKVVSMISYVWSDEKWGQQVIAKLSSKSEIVENGIWKSAKTSIYLVIRFLLWSVFATPFSMRCIRWPERSIASPWKVRTLVTYILKITLSLFESFKFVFFFGLLQ